MTSPGALSPPAASTATRTTRASIQSYLNGASGTVLNADGNSSSDALSDGILILRYLFDPAGAWNVNDALGAGAAGGLGAGLVAFAGLFGSRSVGVLGSDDVLLAWGRPTDRHRSDLPDVPAVFIDRAVRREIAAAGAVQHRAARPGP